MIDHYLDDANQCPKCGQSASGAMNADGSTAAPSEGDLSVCITCHAMLRFEGAPLRLRLLTDEEFGDLEVNERDALLTAVAAFAGPTRAEENWARIVSHFIRQLRATGASDRHIAGVAVGVAVSLWQREGLTLAQLETHLTWVWDLAKK